MRSPPPRCRTRWPPRESPSRASPGAGPSQAQGRAPAVGADVQDGPGRRALGRREPQIVDLGPVSELFEMKNMAIPFKSSCEIASSIYILLFTKRSLHLPFTLELKERIALKPLKLHLSHGAAFPPCCRPRTWPNRLPLPGPLRSSPSILPPHEARPAARAAARPAPSGTAASTCATLHLHIEYTNKTLLVSYY